MLNVRFESEPESHHATATASPKWCGYMLLRLCSTENNQKTKINVQRNNWPTSGYVLGVRLRSTVSIDIHKHVPLLLVRIFRLLFCPANKNCTGTGTGIIFCSKIQQFLYACSKSEMAVIRNRLRHFGSIRMRYASKSSVADLDPVGSGRPVRYADMDPDVFKSRIRIWWKIVWIRKTQ
jgi:hypothetical protein